MNGGDDCKPLSRDEEFKASVRPFCVGNPACPEPPVNGNWSAWTPWSDCTAKCNGGIQTRRRSCSNPLPQRGGQSCAGNINEWRMCNSYTCKDEQKLTQWTPWSNINQTASGYWVQRYRFACTASVPDPKLIKTSHVKTHTRFCTNSTCYKPDALVYNSSVDGDWSNWSTWSRCSADCGTGQRWRSRSCDNPEPTGFGQDCLGPSTEFATCNEQECLATWGPWSVYSTCSVSCGSGTRIRFRSCQIPYVGFNSSIDIACVGISEESEPCIQQVCNDTGLWDVWSAWSECTPDKVQFRHRACLEHTPEECRGQSVEVQPCFFLGAGTVLKQTSMGYRREYTMIHLTVVGCAAFFMGVVICVGIYLCFHNWKSIRSYDLQKPANENVYDKPRFGSFASQLSLDFLTVNNKVYDSCTLSSRGTAVIKDNTFRKDKYNKNFPENMYATIRTNHSLRTEV